MKLVLLRHGESVWNEANRFAGWADVDLSERGVSDAQLAGRAIASANILIDTAFTSVLRRAIKTLWISLEEVDRMWIPVRSSWRLNERHYGALEGLDRKHAALQYGEKQLQLWRRSYNECPPPLEPGDPRLVTAIDPRYRALSQFPRAESLKDTETRLSPYWKSHIAPELLKGSNVLVVAHGNSLRVFRKILEGISEVDASKLKIETGQLHIYEIDDRLNPISRFDICS